MKKVTWRRDYLLPNLETHPTWLFSNMKENLPPEVELAVWQEVGRLVDSL